MTAWTPTYRVLVNSVEITDVVIANLTITSGRTDIYAQPVAGYCQLQLMNLDNSSYNFTVGTSITVECSNNTFDAIDTLVISTTATSITYYNTGSTVATISASGTIYAAPATFNSTLTSAAISAQVSTATTNNLTFLALDTLRDELRKITFENLMSQVMLTGTIMAYAASTPIPAGWLLCDGAEYSTTLYSGLYTIIGSTYGAASPGFFKVPDYTSTATGGYTIYNIIKT
jgi:microcystin-dependent protein